MRNERFLFCFFAGAGAHPQFLPLLRAAEIIARDHCLDGHVIVPEENSSDHAGQPAGIDAANDFDETSSPLSLHQLPARAGNLARFGFEDVRLNALLRRLKPDYVWIHGEFWGGIAHQFLRRYRFRRLPRIVAYVATNRLRDNTPVLSGKWPFLSRTRLTQACLWPRLNGVAACAARSVEWARRIGLPQSVPVVVNYLPVFGPQGAGGKPIAFPWDGNGSFTIGFAGCLSEQKGWQVLLDAVDRLPERVKVVIAGDGEQRDELKARLQRPALRGRVHYAGLVPKARLLATYPSFDLFVLPSVTAPPSAEQFGCVLAEAMACGVPVIGSDSGAIPETVGEAGLIVPERDADALAAAIMRMSEDIGLRRRAAARGLRRYRAHYSCEAYADSIAELLGVRRRISTVTSSGERGQV